MDKLAQYGVVPVHKVGLKVFNLIECSQLSLMAPYIRSFIVFFFTSNDLPTVVKHSQIHMYTDDIQLHCYGISLDVVQEQLDAE